MASVPGAYSQQLPADHLPHYAYKPKDTTPDSTGVDVEWGRRPDHIVSWSYGGLLLEDTLDIVSSPLRWTSGDWVKAALLSGVVVGLTKSDEAVRDNLQGSGSVALDAATRQIQRFGAEYSFLMLAGFGVFGEIGKNDRAKAVAMDGIASSLISAGIIVPVLKTVIGRSRPNTSDETLQFKPLSGHYSFPSGHTTQAFAMATVIASHYDEWWIKGLAYSLAAGVGYSRIHQNSHYVTDVVAGAIIGTVVARAVVRRHDLADDGRWSVTPIQAGGMTGIAWSKTF